MKKFRIITLVALLFSFFATSSCSNDEENIPEEIIANEDDADEVDNPDTDTPEGADTDNDDDETDDDMGDDGMEDDGMEDDETDNAASLSERFSFIGNLVIENSYNTGGCDSPPCDTNDESLDDFFVSGQPDDPYFKLTDDESLLLLECQMEKGRRIEFKQRSEGSLTSVSIMEFEGIYYDIPPEGMTIAQVHNRGGSSNKPFFRLELHNDKLETVIRRDPEVSSSDTSFIKEDFSFVGGDDYDQSPLKVVLEKGDGVVSIRVEQNGEVILSESFQPDTGTRWVTNSGIANGFYLKAGIYNAAANFTKNLVLGYATFKFQTEDQ